MASKAFNPKVQVTMGQLRSLYREPGVLERLGATATADSAHDGYEARLAIDDDPDTIWHTAWDPVDPLPHHLTIDLKESLPVRGLTYLPRQDMTNGRIARYEIHVSGDGMNWQQKAVGEWPNSPDLKTVRFDSVVTARYLRLVALSEVNGQNFTSAAEVDIPLQ
jgi:beta-galactosidase